MELESWNTYLESRITFPIALGGDGKSQTREESEMKTREGTEATTTLLPVDQAFEVGRVLAEHAAPNHA
jgi:hypothetical protein